MARKTQTGPITQEHMAMVAQAQKGLSDVQAVISQLEALGEDVTHYRQQSAHWDGQLRKIVQVFGGTAK